MEGWIVIIIVVSILLLTILIPSLTKNQFNKDGQTCSAKSKNCGCENYSAGAINHGTPVSARPMFGWENNV